MDQQQALLRAENLSCIRDDRVLFSGLSFALNAQQILLLEGQNGSGKTSLLRILCGFREADTGQVLWRGLPINNHRFHSEMAYVGHLDGIKRELTVEENLTLALAINRPGQVTLEQALDKVRLTGYNDTLAQTLSAGQKRRLSLARLLITDTILWILDEPFTSLDKQGITLIESVMLEHVRGGGMIVLTSHHDVVLHDSNVQQINLSECH